jgi:adenylate cyclase
MKFTGSYQSIFSGVARYRLRTVLYIAIFWTVVDILVTIMVKDREIINTLLSLPLRETIVFIMSCGMGYLFVFTLRDELRSNPPLVNFILKTIILLVAAFLMNFLVHFLDDIWIEHKTRKQAFNHFVNNLLPSMWLFQKILYWLILFTITQLYIEINEKYSPGVFRDIVLGKYRQPQIEKRIIMFMDLKDSTPIAEKLGHLDYFRFIRDFIYHVSMALIEHNGRIYQYVGDEVVVSWLSEKKNTKKCMTAIIAARRNLQKNSEVFRRKYDIVPEFRVGIHMGEVTVGEIGVIKKDLAMSGDTMNTTARIRSACNELNQKFIMSKDFMDSTDLEEWQGESLGIVDLKGKANGIELFSLKV